MQFYLTLNKKAKNTTLLALNACGHTLTTQHPKACYLQIHNLNPSYTCLSAIILPMFHDPDIDQILYRSSFYFQVVNALLENGAQVDLADADHRTALRAAAWGGHEEIVSRLLSHGACVNQVDNEGRTALIAAAYMGHTDIVQQLLDHDALINHEDSDGRTALSVASLCVPASEGHARVVSLLLERGTEVDHRDKDGMTPLLVAAFEGHSEVRFYCVILLTNVRSKS